MPSPPNAPGGGPEPSPSLAGISLNSQISELGGGAAVDAPGASELPTPALGGRLEPSPSLAGVKVSSQMSGALSLLWGFLASLWLSLFSFLSSSLSSLSPGDAPGVSELPLPAVGARVRCEGLTGAPEMNGCVGRVVGLQVGCSRGRET
jgi:hypothetical protein